MQQTNPETILIAEDDTGVLKMMCVVLEHFGYKTLAAHDGAEALTLLESDVFVIDLLVTDLVMPRVSGRELLRRLACSQRAIRVLVCCGAEGIDGLPHLAKPFTPQQLRDAVEHALSGPMLSESRARAALLETR